MKYLASVLLTIGVTLLVLTVPSSAQMCQHCVHDYFTCRWMAGTMLRDCLDGASTPAERQRCVDDYNRELRFCGWDYRSCQQSCEA